MTGYSIYIYIWRFQISMVCSPKSSKFQWYVPLYYHPAMGAPPFMETPMALRVEITPQIQPLVGCERERHGDSPGRGGWKRKWRVSLDRCLVSICDFLDIGDAGRSGTFFQLTLWCCSAKNGQLIIGDARSLVHGGADSLEHDFYMAM